MKTKLLMIAFLFAALELQSGAAVSVDQTLKKEYIINSGYSEQIADTINVGRARALGEEYYTDAEKEYANDTSEYKFWRRFVKYFDPAADDFSFYHHDSKPVPSTNDL